MKKEAVGYRLKGEELKKEKQRVRVREEGLILRAEGLSYLCRQPSACDRLLYSHDVFRLREDTCQ
jgi:hypothetical protein